jgi:hypothetical protein
MLGFCFFLVVFYYGIGTLCSYPIGDVTDSRMQRMLYQDAKVLSLHAHGHFAWEVTVGYTTHNTS